jgi:hypothetical protein
LSARRLAVLGATLEVHHGLVGREPGLAIL